MMTQMTPAFRIASALLLALAFSAWNTPPEAADFHSNPRVAVGGDGEIWFGCQTVPASDRHPEYEIRSYDPASGAWSNRGRFSGVLAGMAAGDGRLYIATRAGSLAALGDEANPVALPDNRFAIIDLVWFDGHAAALDAGDGRFGLVLPGGDHSWIGPEPIVGGADKAAKSFLIPIDGALHLLWKAGNADLSGGAVVHLARDNGRWREEPSLPLGGGGAFTVFADKGNLRLMATVSGLLGGGRTSRLVDMVCDGGVWTPAHPLSEAVADRLAAAYDFAAADFGTGKAWLTVGLDGAWVILENNSGVVVETRLAPGPAAGMDWSAAVTLAFILLTAFLLVRACRKSRLLSLAAPGSRADLMSRAVALFIDWCIISLGVAAYHLAAGDLNLYEEFLTAGMLSEAFWINLIALALFAAAGEAAVGMTPGKWLTGLRVRSIGGGPPGFFQAVLRNLCRAIDMYPDVVFPGLIGIVAAVLNKRRQRIGDLAAGTVVRRHAPPNRRPIILASASPRRKDLLEALGLEFDCRPAEIDEDSIQGRAPAETARLRAEAKAKAVYERSPPENAIIVAADTMVVFDGQILGKPADAEDAKRMLGLLSGRSHRVITGVMVWDAALKQGFSDVEETEVEFRSLVQDEIDRYVESGDPLDKAGAYGVQSGYLARQIRGSLSNVAGMPMELLRNLLDRLDS